MILSASIHHRLKHQHESIGEILASTPAARIHFIPQSGKWSIHDNITHLAKYQPVFMERMKTILKENDPSFKPYKAEEDPDFEKWRTRTTEELLATLNADRMLLLKFLDGLTHEKLSRTGNHPRFGKLTVTGWTEFFLLHEAHHIFTIFQLANFSTERML